MEHQQTILQDVIADLRYSLNIYTWSTSDIQSVLGRSIITSLLQPRDEWHPVGLETLHNIIIGKTRRIFDE